MGGRGAGANGWRPRRCGAAGSCDLTRGNEAALHAHAVRVYASDLCYRSEWGSLDLGRHRNHLGALGVQKRAAEGQVGSLLLRRPHRSAREGAALIIGSSLVLY
jgi:hypothetical protein